MKKGYIKCWKCPKIIRIKGSDFCSEFQKKPFYKLSHHSICAECSIKQIPKEIIEKNLNYLGYN